MTKKRITLPIIVEGKYDKIKLTSIFECRVFTTDGFGIFNSKEKQALLRRVASNGIIVLSDTDGGGRQIRSFLNSIVPKDKIFNLYIPRIEGKERRKVRASRSGVLGVEGMEPEVLEKILLPFTEDGGRVEKTGENSTDNAKITTADLYQDGLTGAEASSARRAALARALGLPEDMRAKAFLEALNIILTKEEYAALVKEILV